MTRKAILAIDQGTTNTKALLVSIDGEVIASASAPTGTDYPQAGWAEQSAQGIWESSAQVLAEVAATPDVGVLAIGISNQRESVLLWDAETSEPVGPCVIWQCRRSDEICTALREQGLEEAICAKSGLGLDPLFSAGKWRWLLDNVPEARQLLEQGCLRAGTVDSWLLWKLTGGAVHSTDRSNASRTQLLNLDSGEWDAELADWFGVPLSILPKVRPSDSLFGVAAGVVPGLPAGIPIHAIMGDSHAALFGHGIDSSGRIKVTLGTGSSLMCPTGARKVSANGLSETIAWNQGGAITYALEGNIAVSGQAAAFAAELLGLPDAEALTDLAKTVPNSDGVTVLPALAGLGAPHWEAAARGLISGLSLSTRPAHVARASLEGIAHQICDVVEAIEADLGASVEAIHADGGATRNELLVQLIANICNRPVQIAQVAELSALGVARMVATAAGHPIAASSTGIAARVSPAMDPTQRSRLRSEWHTAIEQSKIRAAKA